MRSPHMILAGALVAASLATSIPVGAQDHSLQAMEWQIQNLRPHGQPVIPVFDGWIPKADGTRDLCFGYINLNTKEVFEIPIGPNNMIEPAQFNGAQPTHFKEVPRGYRRYYCTFTVNVPADFTEKVVWTLRVGGKPYSVPGHTAAPEYLMEDLDQASREVVAPVVTFTEPAGADGRGRTTPATAGPVRASVGTPLTLTASVADPTGAPTPSLITWVKHSGPVGSVTFSPDEIDLRPGTTTATTTATFSEPGDYVLRMQAIDGGRGSYGFHCCWTNGFVQVTVAP